MVKKITSALLILTLIATASSSLVGYFGSEYWYLDLFSHFKVQYSILLIFLIVGLGILKKKKASLIGLLLLSINLIDILPLYYAGNDDEREGTTMSVCSINLLSSNSSFKLVGDYIEAEQPDILILEELTTLWEIALDSILVEYPYQLSIPRMDNFGIGLYSRIPPDTIQNVIVNDAFLPSILSTFTVGTDTIHLLATHPLPPVGQFEFESRNNALKRMASLRTSMNGHFILIGDLNTTSFSQHFKKLKKKSGLADTRKGFGILNTWPADIAVLKVTLDHCLISDGLVVIDRKIGPNIGSDHLPIFAKIGIRR